jgi:hypothetical protein
MCLGQAGGRRATLREYASVNLFQTARTCHTLPGARLYLLDDNNKIKTEHVIFYAAQD